MVKGLFKKLVLPLVFMGVLGSGCGHYDEKLIFDESKVFYDTESNDLSFGWRDVKEKKKDGTVIKYDIHPNLIFKPDTFNLIYIRINGEFYSYSDSIDAPVFDSANIRVHKLIDRYYFVRDSTKRAKGFNALK